jgi:heat shock protein HslJ
MTRIGPVSLIAAASPVVRNAFSNPSIAPFGHGRNHRALARKEGQRARAETPGAGGQKVARSFSLARAGILEWGFGWILFIAAYQSSACGLPYGLSKRTGQQLYKGRVRPKRAGCIILWKCMHDKGFRRSRNMKRIVLAMGLCAGLFILAGCGPQGSQQGSGSDLTGKMWTLSALMGKSLVPGTAITAQFTAAGAVSGSAGCNQYAGTYTVSGNTIKVSSPLASTMMACPQEVMDQESAYLKALGEAKTYAVRGDQLTLADANKTTVATYGAQSQDLAGTSWEAIAYNNGKQAVTSVLAGSTITASFGQDGTLSGNAGCNDYNGTYTVTGNQIVIGPLASTRMFCNDPVGVMDQEAQYLAALATAATYQVEGTVLELRSKDGALAVQYSRK